MDRATAEERTTNDGGNPIPEGLARIGFKADEVRAELPLRCIGLRRLLHYR
jgi:hypothetical protein